MLNWLLGALSRVGEPLLAQGEFPGKELTFGRNPLSRPAEALEDYSSRVGLGYKVMPRAF